jgi:hypothetical protein
MAVSAAKRLLDKTDKEISSRQKNRFFTVSPPDKCPAYGKPYAGILPWKTIVFVPEASKLFKTAVYRKLPAVSDRRTGIKAGKFACPFPEQKKPDRLNRKKTIRLEFSCTHGGPAVFSSKDPLLSVPRSPGVWLEHEIDFSFMDAPGVLGCQHKILGWIAIIHYPAVMIPEPGAGLLPPGPQQPGGPHLFSETGDGVDKGLVRVPLKRIEPFHTGLRKPLRQEAMNGGHEFPGDIQVDRQAGPA